MKHRILARHFVCAALLLTISLSTNAYAIEIGQPIHAPVPVTTGNTKQQESGSNDMSSGSASTASGLSAGATGSNTTSSGMTGSATISGSSSIKTGVKPSKALAPPLTSGKPLMRLGPPLMKACDAHAPVINTIMDRASTRDQNQITLFSGIAIKVEAYYVSQGKTATNYDSIVAAVTTAENQATTDLAMLKTAGTFNCNAADPGDNVTTFRNDLKTEQTDLQALRSAVKNLIVAVAQAEGVNLPASTSTTTPGTQNND
jgi:hypothetical protein